ncbi:MAG: pyridoxal phosphate-dependent class II aminotransferase [Chlorobiales bacterium]|nr:pyridoxal phosphate-dependent class II aminotransferase [Chlorobiales bacterium]
MLTGHGDDTYAHTKEIIANFSSNVWHGGPPQGLKEHLFSSWSKIASYPEMLSESLRLTLARHYQVEAGNILVCNGATEAIYLIAQLFRQKETAILCPTFSEYEDACKIFEHSLSFAYRNELQEKSLPEVLSSCKDDTASDLIFICNPNNPTGELFSLAEIEQLLARFPKTVVVIDEAFIEFTANPSQTVLELLSSHSNLVVLRSMTKLFAIPGLRLGYILADERLIKKLEALKQPWSVNTFAIEAGKFVIDNYPDTVPNLAELLGQTKVFASSLAELEGLHVMPTCTHFLLCELTEGSEYFRSATRLKAFLLENFGILIRDSSNFRGCHEGHFRVATLTADKNLLLTQALKEWKQKSS